MLCYFNNRLAGICLKIAAPLRWAVMRITTGSFPAAHFCKFERLVRERGREKQVQLKRDGGKM